MNKQILVDYTVSDKQTYNLIHCFTDVSITIAEDVTDEDIQKFLDALYPMFTVYIENIAAPSSTTTDTRSFATREADDMFAEDIIREMEAQQDIEDDLIF